jgi:hypothetical protein
MTSSAGYLGRGEGMRMCKPPDLVLAVVPRGLPTVSVDIR